MRKERGTDPGRPPDDVGRAKVERMLRQKPRTLEELQDASGHTDRTLYRWFKEMEEKGLAIRRANRGYPATYEIG